MLKEDWIQRQEELKKYLREMAKSEMDEDQLRPIVCQFKSLYSNNFRHSYSDLFPLIADFAKDIQYNLDYLSNNLEVSRRIVEEDFFEGEKQFKGLYKPLSKLSDHINLEIGRLIYYSVNEQKVCDLENKNQKLYEEIKEAEKNLEEARDKVSSVQTELIAVLSIFAAIVLTFAGGISYIGNALSGMSTAPFFKSVFFVALCGFVIFNTIFLMMYIVGKIIGRNIYARCETEDCTCDNGKPKCCGIKRIRKRLPYVYWLNIGILGLMLLTLILWELNATFYYFPTS